MIYSGRMRERVTLQKPVEQHNPFGEATLVWEDVTTLWAQVTTLSARDYFAAQQSGTLATHRVIVRFFKGMSPTYRLIWRGRTMEIVSVLEREDRSLHEMLAREDVAT